MKTKTEAGRDAVAGQVERPVGRLESERAEDRTLLALAAAAAEIPCKGWCQPGARTDGWHGMYTGSDDDGAYKRWNPLTDDGDALRLAVTLRITVEQGDGWSDAGGWCTVYHSDHGGDACAATRRAIVRVAAGLANSKTPNAVLTGAP